MAERRLLRFMRRRLSPGTEKIYTSTLKRCGTSPYSVEDGDDVRKALARRPQTRHRLRAIRQSRTEGVAVAATSSSWPVKGQRLGLCSNPGVATGRMWGAGISYVPRGDSCWRIWPDRRGHRQDGLHSHWSDTWQPRRATRRTASVRYRHISFPNPALLSWRW
jgi:hypothetical protein